MRKGEIIDLMDHSDITTWVGDFVLLTIKRVPPPPRIIQIWVLIIPICEDDVSLKILNMMPMKRTIDIKRLYVHILGVHKWMTHENCQTLPLPQTIVQIWVPLFENWLNMGANNDSPK